MRLPHVLFQPMAADDVATAVAEAALNAPLNGTVEIAGTFNSFHLDELVGKVLAYDKDTFAESDGGSGGAILRYQSDNQMLRPGPNPRLGSIKFDWWLTHVPPPPKK